MSESNYNQIFKSQLKHSINIKNPFKDAQLLQLFQQSNELVNQIQQNYDKKIDFRKSQTPKAIVNYFSEIMNALHENEEKLERLQQQLIKANQNINQLQANIQSIQKSFNQKEQDFLKVNEEKQNEIRELTNEIDKLLKKKKQDESNESDKNYDITIDIKSLRNIQKEPIKVIYSEERGITKQSLSQMKTCSFVALLGLKNKGKTFLLNELNNENFPSGYHYSTSGISVKIDDSDQNNIKVYLDSEGINKPARYNWNKDTDFQNYVKLKQENNDASCNNADAQFKRNFQTRVTEKFQDIKSTEEIQMNFLIEHSETIIIVVGIISLEEQKIISVISEMCDKDIIVVHNLKEYSKCEHVESEIEKNLYDLFPLEKRGIDLFKSLEEENKYVYQDQRNERVFHCVLAKKDTPAGDYYNRFSYNYIQQKIQLNENKKNKNISEEFQYFLNKYMRDFLQISYSSEDKKNVKVSQEANLLFIEEKESCDEISLDPEYEIISTKDILLDVFGRFRNMINYSIHQQGTKKILEIELPGNTKLTKATLIKEGEYQIIIIQATKELLNSEQQGQEIFNNRNLGQVYHRIKVGRTQENLKITKKFIEKRGIYTCELEITNSEYGLSIEDNQ